MVGRWSLDELPQLWNVVTGEMSLSDPPFPESDFMDYQVHHFAVWARSRGSRGSGR